MAVGERIAGGKGMASGEGIAGSKGLAVDEGIAGSEVLASGKGVADGKGIADGKGWMGDNNFISWHLAGNGLDNALASDGESGDRVGLCKNAGAYC